MWGPLRATLQSPLTLKTPRSEASWAARPMVTCRAMARRARSRVGRGDAWPDAGLRATASSSQASPAQVITALHETTPPRNLAPPRRTCSSIWMVPACSSSSSSWSLTFASRSLSCFFTLAREASSFDSWEEMSCSSASSASAFCVSPAMSESLSCERQGHCHPRALNDWEAGEGLGATHLQQLLEAKDLCHQHILLSAQLLPLQPFPLCLLMRLRELAVKPAQGEWSEHSAPWGLILCLCQGHCIEHPLPSAAGTGKGSVLLSACVKHTADESLIASTVAPSHSDTPPNAFTLC